MKSNISLTIAICWGFKAVKVAERPQWAVIAHKTQPHAAEIKEAVCYWSKTDAINVLPSEPTLLLQLLVWMTHVHACELQPGKQNHLFFLIPKYLGSWNIKLSSVDITGFLMGLCCAVFLWHITLRNRLRQLFRGFVALQRSVKVMDCCIPFQKSLFYPISSPVSESTSST